MRNKILLVGASTGGPSLIKEILSSITNLSSTVIIVQHMKEEVLPFFIKDLSESTTVTVESTPLVTSFHTPSIIVCSESSVLKKNNSQFEIETDKVDQHYTPDINKLLNSFVPFSNEFDISVLIMTGIGRDGVDGAKNLKLKGAKVFAQDEKSSPVFGMPKAIFESGIVDEVKTFNEIKEYFRSL